MARRVASLVRQAAQGPLELAVLAAAAVSQAAQEQPETPGPSEQLARQAPSAAGGLPRSAAQVASAVRPAQPEQVDSQALAAAPELAQPEGSVEPLAQADWALAVGPLAHKELAALAGTPVSVALEEALGPLA
jgi:hypothetical protein